MFRFALAALVLALVPPLASANSSPAATLDEAMVRKFLAESDAAAMRRDLDAIARMMSDAATVSLTMHIGGRAQPVSLTKNEYLAQSRQALAMASHYDYQRGDTKISMTGANRAVVNATTTEVLRIQGQTVRSSTRSTTVIEIIGGRPLITRITAATQM